MECPQLFRQILQDVEGVYSSKRVVAFLGLLCLIISWGSDLFYQTTSTEYIFNGFLFLVIGALGITGIEHFANRRTETTTTVNANVSVPPADE